MADPFDVLRAPLTPIAPDPSFAARLRARLEQALASPEGASVPTATVQPTVQPVPTMPAGVVPYLAVGDAARAIEWYVEAFDARARGEPVVMPDGRIGHAELEIAGGLVMLSDAHPELGIVAPEPGAGVTFTLHVTVADVDAATERALVAGATLERPPADHPYGRNAVVHDPFGHRWMLASPPPTPVEAPTLRHGDVAYVSLWVPDVERAAAFYATVLGWRYRPDHDARGRQVEGLRLHHGLWGGEARPTLFVCFAVDDLTAALERVRTAGGRAAESRSEPYGMVSDCADDQGMPFALFQSPSGSAEPTARGPETGTGHGDLAYITFEVVDSARFRTFFASVLGWRFTPGRAEDGWGVEDVIPMIGVHGGHEAATGVPMYRVDDIVLAVERVRDAGGEASDPERHPYGITSDCTDDQGTRFYLGQLSGGYEAGSRP